MTTKQKVPTKQTKPLPEKLPSESEMRRILGRDLAEAARKTGRR